MAAEPERLTCVLAIDCDHLGEWTANAAYILTLKVSYDCRPAPQHVMSWNLGLIGREAARVAGAPMTVAYGPADHAYKVAASAEGPVGWGGRSRPIASYELFRAITVARKGLYVLQLCIYNIVLFDTRESCTEYKFDISIRSLILISALSSTFWCYYCRQDQERSGKSEI